MAWGSLFISAPIVSHIRILMLQLKKDPDGYVQPVSQSPDLKPLLRNGKWGELLDKVTECFQRSGGEREHEGTLVTQHSPDCAGWKGSSGSAVHWKQEFGKMGKGISTSSRKLWLKCVMARHLIGLSGRGSMLQSLKEAWRHLWAWLFQNLGQVGREGCSPVTRCCMGEYIQ